MRVASLALVFAVATAVLACQRRTPAPLPSADPLPLLARDQLTGGRLDVARLAGKTVVVNFWSPG